MSVSQILMRVHTMVNKAATAGRYCVIVPTTVTTEAASTRCFVVSGSVEAIIRR